MQLKYLFSTLTFLVVTSAGAHGEEKPGPNGGHIKMPGGFHTELEIDPVQGAHIFLLDMNFKNPTVKDSSVSAFFETESDQISYNCGIMGNNHFHCVPSKKLPTKGELHIKATREKAIGNEVVYSIPLQEFDIKTKPAPVDHSGH